MTKIDYKLLNSCELLQKAQISYFESNPFEARPSPNNNFGYPDPSLVLSRGYTSSSKGETDHYYTQNYKIQIICIMITFLDCIFFWMNLGNLAKILQFQIQ